MVPQYYRVILPCEESAASVILLASESSLSLISGSVLCSAEEFVTALFIVGWALIGADCVRCMADFPPYK